MSKCPACGAEGAYNSGFSVECVSPSCSFYSAAHARSAGPSKVQELALEYPEQGRMKIINKGEEMLYGDVCYSYDHSTSMSATALHAGKQLVLYADPDMRTFSMELVAKQETVVEVERDGDLEQYVVEAHGGVYVRKRR